MSEQGGSVDERLQRLAEAEVEVLVLSGVEGLLSANLDAEAAVQSSDMPPAPAEDAPPVEHAVWRYVTAYRSLHRALGSDEFLDRSLAAGVAGGWAYLVAGDWDRRYERVSSREKWH